MLSYIFVVFVFVLPLWTFAQSQPGFVPLAPITTKSGNLYGGGGDLSTFLNNLFKFAIAIGAIGAVLRLAYAGYLYMGSDMWTQKGKAKEVISNVVLGLILLLAVWLILNQINPDILSFQALKTIRDKPVQSGQSGQGQTPANSTIGGSPALNCTGSNNSFCMNGTPQTTVQQVIQGQNSGGYSGQFDSLFDTNASAAPTPAPSSPSGDTTDPYGFNNAGTPQP
jgi:hypothetical protein